MRTAGRGNRSAAAGADRMATSRARRISADAVAASVTAGGNSATTAPAVASAATTPATATPTSPAAAFGQRGGYHQSTDRDSEHERAKNRHRVPPPSA
jgi:hypothetical protein